MEHRGPAVSRRTRVERIGPTRQVRNQAAPEVGSCTPEGGFPVQGNVGGHDQSPASLKSTLPPENLVP